MTFLDKIKWRIKLLKIILKEPVNKSFRAFLLIHCLPSNFFLIKKIKEKYIKKWAQSFPNEKILDLKLFKIILKETDYEPVFWESLDLIYPYLTNDFSLIREGAYEKNGVDLKPGDVVVDAGAYLGIFSLFASKKIGPKGKVYAFEPISENYQLFKKTIELNKAKNIEIIPWALGKKRDLVSMMVEGDKFNISSGFFKKGSKERKVKQISLDDFIEQRKIPKVDFIKADLEGMEKDFLLGAEKTIKKFKPRLSICTYHKPEDSRVLEQLIRSFAPQYKIDQTEAKLYSLFSKIKIVAICLIKNEDLYIERVLKNIIDFSDEIIVLDNMSSDKTFEIVRKLSQKYKKIRLFKIKDAFLSHKFIEKYANTNTWIFGVDGDEIYDPDGLLRLREEILTGKYQKKWRIWGNSLNCEELDLKTKIAKGYLSPPSRLMTKLYNFSILKSWKEDYAQRLHGTNLIFKKGFNKSLEENIPYFKVLHLCFVNRTSLAKKYRNPARLGPQEALSIFPSLNNFISNLLKGRISRASAYKLRKYKKGRLIFKNVQSFFK